MRRRDRLRIKPAARQPHHMPDLRGLSAEARPPAPHQEPEHDRCPLLERLPPDRNHHHAGDQARDADRERERAQAAES